MKKFLTGSLVTVILFSFIACDPGATATIELTNRTSHDLSIGFVIKEGTYLIEERNEYAPLDVKKGEMVYTVLGSLGGWRNPHREIQALTLTDLNSGELLKEYSVESDDFFKLYKTRNSMMHKRGYFAADITEEMLQ